MAHRARAVFFYDDICGQGAACGREKTRQEIETTEQDAGGLLYTVGRKVVSKANQLMAYCVSRSAALPTNDESFTTRPIRAAALATLRLVARSLWRVRVI